MFKLLQRLVPTYGNWGGPGWSGGEWQDDTTKTKWNVQPIDELDRAFREHDMAYQAGVYTNRAADIMLLRQLMYNCNIKGWYANTYKVATTIVFFIKALVSSL